MDSVVPTASIVSSPGQLANCSRQRLIAASLLSSSTTLQCKSCQRKESMQSLECHCLRERGF